MNEVYPVTSCEVSLASTISSIEFDTKKIADYMRSIGFTDEQITATAITAESYERHMSGWDLPPDHDYRVLGQALLNALQVAILPGAMASAADFCRAVNTYGPVDGVMTPKQFDDAASKKYSRVTAHELLHLIKDIDEDTSSSEETIRSLAEPSSEADAIYQAYRDDPHEAYCRDEEQYAPEDLVHISYRKQPFIRRKIKRLRKQNRRVISKRQ